MYGACLLEEGQGGETLLKFEARAVAQQPQPDSPESNSSSIYIW